MKSFFTLLLVLFFYNANCTTYTAIANGNFEAAGTWDHAGAPGTGDDAIIPIGFIVTVTTNYAPVLGNLYVHGTLEIENGIKLHFGTNSVIQIYTGGQVHGGNPGSKFIFPDMTYVGSFNRPGPFYFSNAGSGSGVLAISNILIETKIVGNAVNIKWQTAYETDMDRFEMQWRDNNYSSWTVLNTTQAKNLNTGSVYTYLDNRMLSLNNFYRVAAIENNGKITYSEIVFVNGKANNNFTLIPKLYNNNLVLDLPNNQQQQISIVDLSGRVMITGSVKNQYQYQLDITSFPKGSYYILLTQMGSKYTARFLKP